MSYTINNIWNLYRYHTHSKIFIMRPRSCVGGASVGVHALWHRGFNPNPHRIRVDRGWSAYFSHSIHLFRWYSLSPATCLRQRTLPHLGDASTFCRRSAYTHTHTDVTLRTDKYNKDSMQRRNAESKRNSYSEGWRQGVSRRKFESLKIFFTRPHPKLNPFETHGSIVFHAKESRVYFEPTRSLFFLAKKIRTTTLSVAL